MESPGNVIFLTKRAGLILLIILLFLALLMIFYPISKSGKMQSRSSVKGVVYNAAGVPVENATIMIIDGAGDFQDIASISNEKGEFFLSNIIIPGTYIIQIQGSNTVKKREVHIQSKDTIIKIHL